MTATEQRLADLGEPQSSRAYLLAHPEHIPAVAVPVNPPAVETGD